MFRLHQRRRGLHGYGSSTALVTANESVCVLYLCQARWPRASLQPHVSRRRVFLTEQLNRRFLAFPIQPLSRLRAERTQQIHNVSVYYKRGQLLVTRVEQALGMSDPVAHSQDAIQTWLELATISAFWPRSVESGSPNHGLARAVREMDPESKCEIRDDGPRRCAPRQPSNNGIDCLTVNPIRIELSPLRLSHDRSTYRGGVVKQPVRISIPAFAHNSIVGIPQRNLEMGYVTYEHLTKCDVPLVEFKRKLNIAPAVNKIGGKTLGRELAFYPLPCGSTPHAAVILKKRLLGHCHHRTPPIDMIEAR